MKIAMVLSRRKRFAAISTTVELERQNEQNKKQESENEVEINEIDRTSIVWLPDKAIYNERCSFQCKENILSLMKIFRGHNRPEKLSNLYRTYALCKIQFDSKPKLNRNKIGENFTSDIGNRVGKLQICLF
ncbi:hypothetical protein BpHYR1_016515 [Brachionus plicatilis]|uniref:Uncharacterized protein n=1 Tax=Brachionus plicatilis TaxID=10195 RepID=A0A3M7R7G5_BRAPC|nr:hypothetical protein BpHYR1_016515 [Brachionus plicatilis]